MSPRGRTATVRKNDSDTIAGWVGYYLRNKLRAAAGSVPDLKHFGTDPNPEFDIVVLLIRILSFFSACLESTCKFSAYPKHTECCITCLNINELM
jgi:hypothetical protein